MATGVESVDVQHRQLIAWLNELLAAMREGRGRNDVGRLLDDLAGYTATHFAHEEGCMRQYRCPAAAGNVAAHREFMRTFADLKAEFERTGPTSVLAVRAQQQLLNWLATHIRKTDTHLLPCVRRETA